jgi:hypothetical protein
LTNISATRQIMEPPTAQEPVSESPGREVTADSTEGHLCGPCKTIFKRDLETPPPCGTFPHHESLPPCSTLPHHESLASFTSAVKDACRICWTVWHKLPLTSRSHNQESVLEMVSTSYSHFIQQKGCLRGPYYWVTIHVNQVVNCSRIEFRFCLQPLQGKSKEHCP